MATWSGVVGPCPLMTRQRRELRVGVEGQADGGGPPGGHRLAVGCHELGVAADRPLGVGHAGDRRAPSASDRLGDRLADRTAAAGVVGEGGLAPDLEVDVLVDVAEQRGEGVVQGVGEDEGPRDEGHPEHDGHGGEGQAQLVGQQALDGDLPHLSCPTASSAPAPSRRWAPSARRPPCRRPGRPPGRRRPRPGRRG